MFCDSAYLKMNEKLSLLIRIPVKRHALILNTFDVAVLYYLAC